MQTAEQSSGTPANPGAPPTHATSAERRRQIRPRGATAAPALAACLAEGRRPSPQEINIVAARIWRDFQIGQKQTWQDVAAGSPAHRRVIAIAQAALGAIAPHETIAPP